MTTVWNILKKIIEPLQIIINLTRVLAQLSLDTTEGVVKQIKESADEYRQKLKKTVLAIIFSTIILIGLGLFFKAPILFLIAAIILGICTSYIGVTFSALALLTGIVFEKASDISDSAKKVLEEEGPIKSTKVLLALPLSIPPGREDLKKAAEWGKKVIGLMFGFLLWEHIVVLGLFIAPPWRNPYAALIAAIAGITLGLMAAAWGTSKKQRYRIVFRTLSILLLILSMAAIWFPHTARAVLNNADSLDKQVANYSQFVVVKSDNTKIFQKKGGLWHQITLGRYSYQITEFKTVNKNTHLMLLQQDPIHLRGSFDEFYLISWPEKGQYWTKNQGYVLVKDVEIIREGNKQKKEKLKAVRKAPPRGKDTHQTPSNKYWVLPGNTWARWQPDVFFQEGEKIIPSWLNPPDSASAQLKNWAWGFQVQNKVLGKFPMGTSQKAPGNCKLFFWDTKNQGAPERLDILIQRRGR